MPRALMLACLLAGAMLGCRAVDSHVVPGASRGAGQPSAPEVLLAVDGAGLMRAVQSSSGRLVLVSVWATWCAACVQELPDLVRLQRDYAERGLDVLFVSVDPITQREAASQQLASVGAVGPHYIKEGPDMPFMNQIDDSWRGLLPATALYGVDGEQIAFWEGPVDYATLQGVLETVNWP